MTAKTRKFDRGQPFDAGETRAAVAVTVAWMLTCMSTALAMVVVLALHVFIAVTIRGDGRHPLANVAGMLLAVALLTGSLCLLFTPLALRSRQNRPPLSIVVLAVMIGLAPLVTIAALMFRGA